MLLTNISVAQHIAVNLPEQALLRRHDTPIERRLVRSLFLLANRYSIFSAECIRRACRAPWV
jgi:exoribonuclease R